VSNDLYHSAELRWFLPEQSPWDRILHWFTLQGRLPINVEGQYDPRTVTRPFVKLERERIDEYLLLPQCDTVGVKQRQGKLEVKALIAGPRPFSLGGVVGRVDQWVKWSFDPSEAMATQLEIELDQSGPWRRVVKKRYTQKISLDSVRLIAVPPDQYPEAGCNIELTMIDVQAIFRTWLTFGFEAFGPSARVMALLDEAVAHFFAVHGPPPVSLDGGDSLSYPAWLAKLHQDDR
jgi:hypothetical protein